VEAAAAIYNCKFISLFPNNRACPKIRFEEVVFNALGLTFNLTINGEPKAFIN